MARQRKKIETVFAKNLVDLLAVKKLTNKAAAAIAGVSTTSIQDWKNGVAPTDYMAIGRLAKSLGVSMSFLLTGINETEHGDRTPSISEVFASGGALFDGYLKVKIEKLIPREDIEEIPSKKR